MQLGVGGGWLIADLATKRFAAARLAERSLDLLELKGVIVRLVLAHNPAGAWSMFGFVPGIARRLLFVAISVVASVLLTIWYLRLPREERLVRLGLVTVLGGALGNLVDRIAYGSVIDFIEVSAFWGETRHFWPTFNIADVAISVGVGLLLLQMVRGKK